MMSWLVVTVVRGRRVDFRVGRRTETPLLGLPGGRIPTAYIVVIIVIIVLHVMRYSAK
jgi:hypothetical protein